MEFEIFEQVVKEILKTIPEKYLRILKEEAIEIICREKVPDVLQENYPCKIIFGIFAGTSKKDKNSFGIHFQPTRIEIYKESFEKVFGKEINPLMKDQILKTLIHEMAHHFGFNEEKIREIGY
ncbi:MAG: metallopeptidase family protein [candidate division WOR-3 bacterium]